MNLKFRFLKIETYEGNWKTFYPITEEKLKKIMLKYNPKNTYISVNQFLNYKEHNKTYNFQNHIIFKYGLIDIDTQNFNSKEEAIDYFNKIILFLQKKKIQISEINATNIYGGFQILIHPKSYKRFNYVLTSSLLRGETIFDKIDWKVMDDKRVRRYCPSWNGNKNCYAYPLFLPECFKYHPFQNDTRDYAQPKDLNISKLIENQIEQGVFLSPLFSLHHSLGMPLENGSLQHLAPVLAGKPNNVVENPSKNKADDKTAGNSPNLTSEQRRGQAIKSPLPRHFLVRQISSSVYGSPNNLVLVLKYLQKPPLNRIRRLQKAYSLGDMYILQNHEGFVAISPKTAKKERLEKIYKKARCWKSLSELSKFKQNWIYISNLYDLEQRKSVNTFKFIDVLEQDADGFYSYPHSLLLKKYHNKNYPNLIGTNPRVYTAEFEN